MNRGTSMNERSMKGAVIFSFLSLPVLFLLTSFSCTPGPAPSVQQANEQVIRRIWQEIVNEGNMDLAVELISEDYVYHTPDGRDLGGREEGFIRPVEMLRSAFPDLSCSVDDMIAEGDLVAHRWSARGTHEGEYNGVPATGERIVMTGIVISRIAKGKVVEDWANSDALGVLQQLGRFPGRESGDYTWGEPLSHDGNGCTSEVSRNLYLRELNEVWKEKDTGALTDIFSPAFLNHDPAWPEIVDRESFSGWVAEWHEKAPDMEIVLEQLIVQGDRAAGRWTARWTDTAGLGSIPPSGRELSVTGIDIIRCSDGLIIERWWAKDVLGVLKQAGLFPKSRIQGEDIFPEQ